MQAKRYSPKIDKRYFLIAVPTLVLCAGLTVVAAFAPTALFAVVPVDLLVLYFMISPLFGYAELREESLYVRYGLILKRDIPYSAIRGAVKERKFHSDSMLSLKNAFEHITVKYNKFDLTVVSITDNDTFLAELKQRCRGN
jgi:hypothetical protein